MVVRGNYVDDGSEGTFLTVDINEQLLGRNLCYQLNWVNLVFPRVVTKEFFECYHKLSVELCDCIPHLQPVCLGSGHKMDINRRCDIVNITHKHAHTCF